MKILYITHLADMYGANWSMLDMILQLREYGIVPIVLVPHKGELTEILIRNKIKYIVVPFGRWLYPKGKIKAYRLSLYKIWNEIIAIGLAILFRNDKVTGVHSNSSIIYIGARIAKYLSLPHFWHIRELGEEACKLEYIFRESYVRKRFVEAASVIAISDFVFETTKRKLQLDNMVRIYDGINWEISTRTPRNIDKVNFCYVGLISNQKRQQKVVEACRKLLDQNRTNFKIYLVGGGKEEYIRLIKDYITANSLDEYVEFLGEVNDIQTFLKDMDVGIIASENEAFGRATVEYMLSSMPVIGAASGGTLELVDDGKNGFLFQLDNIDDLAEKMYIYMSEPVKIKRQGEYAYSLATTKFLEKINAMEIYREYQKKIQK